MDLLRRVERLEKMCITHDDKIRQLEQFSTLTWVTSAECELGSTLLAKMRDWQGQRPDRGPHPWGPPRRALGFEMCEFIIKNGLHPTDSVWLKTHQGFSTAEEVDKHSVNLLVVKETFDGRTLIKLRPLLRCL